MQVTIRDIALYCKVSEGTVDRALNNRSGISDRTKKRVLAAAEELNYFPNHTGRSLATGRTMTISIICFDLHNNFFPEIIDTIEAKAKEQGYFIHLILTHKKRELEEEGIRYLLQRHVDGIILFPVGVGQAYIDMLKATGIPIVTIYNRLSSDFSFVGVDDHRAMKEAVGYITSRGYRRIFFLAPDMDKQVDRGLNTYTLQQRQNGYLEGMAENRGHLDAPLVIKGKNLTERLSVIHSLVDAEIPTAVLCVCDAYAIQAIEYLSGHGLRIPQDIGIMGYDDLDILKFIKPRISTIQYSVIQMGEIVFDKLYQSMRNADCKVTTVLLDYQIVPGETLL